MPNSATTNKFGAQSKTYRGVTFASKLEARYAEWCDWRLKVGLIAWWEKNTKHFELQPGRWGQEQLIYTPDFWVVPSEKQQAVYLPPIDGAYYVDCKGYTETEAFAMRVKLWRRNVRQELRKAKQSRGTWTEEMLCLATALPPCPECDSQKAEILPGGVIWFDDQGERCNKLALACDSGHRFVVTDQSGVWDVL